MKITIAQLYPRDMNLYGDWGNTLVLKKRLERRGFEVEIIDHNPGDSTDFSKIDIFVGGGGQDSGQTIIQNDLLARADELRQLAKDGGADADDLRNVPIIWSIFPNAQGRGNCWR